MLVGLTRLRIDRRRHLRLAEARPHRRVRPEAVGEVDESLARENASDNVEIVRNGRSSEQGDADDREQEGASHAT